MEEKKKRVRKVPRKYTYGDYHFQHSDHAPTHFDVFIKGRRAALAYGLKLPGVMEYIALHKMRGKTDDKTLKEFISEFHGLVQEIKMAVGDVI